MTLLLKTVALSGPLPRPLAVLSPADRLMPPPAPQAWRMVLLLTIPVKVPLLWFSRRTPEDSDAPEHCTAALPMKLLTTCPCQLPLPDPSLMLMAPPWRVPVMGFAAVPLFEMLKRTVSVLSTGVALPPEMV